MRTSATITLVPNLVWHLPDADTPPLDARLPRLLAAIKKHATLRAAARETGLSYRAAWGLLVDTGRRLRVPLVELQQGRGARLTEAGEQFLAASERVSLRLRESEFSLQLAASASATARRSRAQLALIASHDLLLTAFCDQWAKPEGVVGDVTFRGSLESLKALARNEADVAGFHAVAPDDRGVAAAFRRLLDPRRDTLIRFANREQGLIVPRGNPENLHTLADVAARQVRFVNRQRGSGTRLLIDQLLRQSGIGPASIRGYETEEYTHLAVAATIAAGQAEAGFGLKAAAARLDLDFVPLRRETYWLAVRTRRLDSDLVRRLRKGLSGAPLRTAVRNLAGYTIDRAGELVALNAAVA
jgi:molybdate transport repressor ModE-like protein